VAKGPTVHDVAERAGVSIATVSFAFGKPANINAATRDIVFAATR
jgi:DNA-binding LacI/PurR family transcriptional regulator